MDTNGVRNVQAGVEIEFYFYFGTYAHPFYRDIALHPPTGFKAVLSAPELKTESTLRHTVGKHLEWWRKPALTTLKAVGYPRIVHVKRPEECAFIHAAEWLLINREPWVTDFEDATAYAWYDHLVLQRPWTRFMIRKVLERRCCRRILPWTEAARQSLLRSLPKGVWEEKVEVLYPCLDARRFSVVQHSDTETVNLLFVGGAFYQKGGVDTVEAFRALGRKYDVTLTVISDFDEQALNAYGHEDGITLLSKVPQDELDRAFAEADIFVMPTHYDTFGLVYLEAMARGLPCVGTTHFAVPEIVQHGKTGLIVKNHCSRFDEQFRAVGTFRERNDPLLDRMKHPPEWALEDLAEKLATLIEDGSLRRELGRNGRKEVETGRFSVQEREKKTRRIYEEAIRG